MATQATVPSLGSRIRAARKAAGLNADQLAALVGATANTVYRWEQDRNTPSVTRLRMIAAHTGTTLAAFLVEETA